MNRIEVINSQIVLITEGGNKYPCRLWTERKIKKGQAWEKVWVMPSRDGVAETGRTYLGYEEVVKSIETNGYYEFETKIEHREGMSHGGWRSKLTDEERKELEQAEAVIERLKNEAMKRERPEKTEREKLLEQIAKLEAKLTNLEGSNN